MLRTPVSRRLLLRVVLAAGLMFALAIAGIALSRFSDRIASVWLANGAVLAIVLRSSRHEWGALLLGAFGANIAANLTMGDSLPNAAGLALCNTLEITFVATLCAARPARNWFEPMVMARFVGIAAAAALISAAAAVTVLQPDGMTGGLAIMRNWWIADVLGLILVTPVSLAFSREWILPHGRRDWTLTLAILAVIAGASAFIFSHPSPWLFLMTPALLFASFRLRPGPAAVIALVASAMAIGFTMAGLGPIASAPIDDEARTLLVQSFVATCFLLTLPVSALTRERDALAESQRAWIDAVQRSERQYRMLAENTSDMILRLTADGTKTFVSAASRKIIGISPEEMLGQSAGAFIHPEDWPYVRSSLAHVADKSGEQIIAYRKLHAEGHYIWVEASYSRIVDDDGTIGIIASVRDIDARKKAELEASYSASRLAVALEEAKGAAEAKSSFLATMSHEIRTPMTGVLGMIDLLRGDIEPADREQYLVTLKQSADLLMAVIDDVLDFSKMEHGMLHLRRCDFNIEELAQSTIDLFFTAASQKGLTISLDIVTSGIPFVRGDPVRLQQVMSNLINNAIKFTDRGTVSVCLFGPDAGAVGRWRLEVCDTGIGIAENDRATLFEPFTQAEGGDVRRFGGTGLGLAISRRLIDAMGGEIGFDSSPGSGSTFWFEVPLDAPATVAFPASPPALVRAAPTTISERPLAVLVAEDNPVNQLLISALLKRDGHVPTCVANGLEAVAAAGRRRFDCILMDMQMPEMDGVGATRAIRNGGGPSADIPIIALTADASPERRRFYDQAGLTDFMTKPIEAEALATRLALIGAPSAPSGDAFDRGHLDNLEEALGQTRLRGLVNLFEVELQRRPSLIAKAVVDGEWALAALEAHSLKGAALSLGALALADATAALERSAGACDGRGVDDELAALDAAVAAALAALPGALAQPRRREA